MKNNQWLRSAEWGGCIGWFGLAYLSAHANPLNGLEEPDTMPECDFFFFNCCYHYRYHPRKKSVCGPNEFSHHPPPLLPTAIRKIRVNVDILQQQQQRKGNNAQQGGNAPKGRGAVQAVKQGGG